MIKKAITLIEIIVVIVIVSITYTLIIPKIAKINELEVVTKRIALYLKYVRVTAFMDDRRGSGEKWYKQRWTLKFLNCKNKEGIYYVIYSDKNMTGHPSRSETMKDPMTNLHLYATNSCKKESKKDSDTVLLTHTYNIEKINLSCNNTSSLGQISFGYDGKIYNRLSDNTNASKINEPCILTLTHKNAESKSIIIENETGYSYRAY